MNSTPLSLSVLHAASSRFEAARQVAGTGPVYLRPIFEHLGGTSGKDGRPGQADYDQIRLVTAHLVAIGELTGKSD